MSLTFAEGFDDDAIDYYFPWSEVSAPTYWSQVAGPDGRGQCIERIASGSSHFLYLAIGDPDEFTFGFRMYTPADGATGYEQFLQFGTSTVDSAYIGVRASNGTAMAFNDNSYTQTAGDLSFNTPTGAWAFYEFHGYVDSVNADRKHLDVYIDGVLTAESEFDPAGGVALDWNTITMTAHSTWVGQKFDDMYLWSGAAHADFPFGDLRIDRILPVGDGAVDDITASYANLDDADPSTSTATSETWSTSGNQLTLQMDTAPTPGQSILGVVYQIYGKGSGRFKPLYRSAGGTTTAASERLPLPADYGMRKVIVNQNPVTAAAWTQSDMTNGEFGLELE